MTITREHVADLQPGDVVELKFTHEYDSTLITARGTFPAITNWYDNYLGGPYTLTVVSRAPRPLYVNHDRAEPVPGDVVRNADYAPDTRVWTYRDPGDTKPWVGHSDSEVAPFRWWNRAGLPARLRLLVDGETGQVVP